MSGRGAVKAPSTWRWPYNSASVFLPPPRPWTSTPCTRSDTIFCAVPLRGAAWNPTRPCASSSGCVPAAVWWMARRRSGWPTEGLWIVSDRRGRFAPTDRVPERWRTPWSTPCWKTAAPSMPFHGGTQKTHHSGVRQCLRATRGSNLPVQRLRTASGQRRRLRPGVCRRSPNGVHPSLDDGVLCAPTAGPESGAAPVRLRLRPEFCPTHGRLCRG